MGTIQALKKDQNNDCGCEVEGNETPTQKTIHNLRKKYCDDLYVAAGEVGRYETKYTGQVTVYKNKKCIFTWTEGNYRRYRNAEIEISSKLLQSNDLIKTNISNYISWNNDLATGLKNIVKLVKDLKTKLGDLRTAADNLEHAKNDSCNCTQMTILTGEAQKNCDAKPGDGKRPEECSDAKDVLDKLICMPKALGFDVDHLFKASSDVVGIQVFSNIGTLEPLQKSLSEDAKSFGKFIQETAKKREGDLKKAQEDLVKAAQEKTKSVSWLYNQRNDFEGIFCTTRAICCPKCGCVIDATCEPRLGKCKDDICDICGQVKETFCNDKNKEKQHQAS